MDAIKPHKSLINTNEVLLKENGTWLHFTQPHQIIQVNVLEDIIPALREIEDLIKANKWYAAGFLSYEAAPAFDPSHRIQPGTGFPYLWFGLYPAPRLMTQPEPAQPKESLAWLPTVDRNTYNAAIEKIKNYISDGQTYQVNYTMRLQTDFNVDPYNFFLHLVQAQNNYAAYIDTGHYIICSASPELFFQLDGTTITCRPMKGTTRRGCTTLEDEARARWLNDSEKNRAENVMIVDMIRNDLGRIAKIGSVNVPELFTVERYPTLWQMTSTIRATTDAPLTEIFTALFPSASITGAPKVSTMRIISELETTPRKIYTGSIGYIAPDRKVTFNVAIRTALIDRENQIAEYGVGGGIVWDSASADEYEEAMLKARVLTQSSPQFSLFETMPWTPEAGFFLREKHITRLLDSANYFDFPVTQESIETHLDQISILFNSPQRVRLLLDKDGNLSSEAKSFHFLEENHPWRVCLAKGPIHSNDTFLFHKTTMRDVYEAARKDHPTYDDVLLYNERGELTEFTVGNLVAEIDGKLYTPPISCGLLAGTFRAYLLERGEVAERVIRAEELKDCAKIFLVNSVKQWKDVHLKT